MILPYDVTLIFGDMPLWDGEERIEVPTGRCCWHCEEPFTAGDSGMVMPTGLAQHRECGYRAVIGGIGHLVDHDYFCGGELGPDAGLSRRASSLLVWAREILHAEPAATREMLLFLTGRFPYGRS